MKKLSQKGFSVIILTVVIILVIIGVGIVVCKQEWISKTPVVTGNPTSIQILDETANWETFVSVDNGATFLYPENLSTSYIRPQEWPPELLIIDDTEFSCEEGGLGIDGRPGMTMQKQINNIIYCINSVSEGAAGTFYTNYTYTFIKDLKLVKLSLVLAYPQCENYNDPQKTECEEERQIFDLDILINHIAESMQL
ncbi:MAG: hypothetical protein HQ541_19320 [Mariniphaga sp.]|nr:hypothetical protein [Mariniphaga sp.]